MYQFIETSVKDRVGFIILNDPPKLNALSQPMAAELAEVLEKYRFDPEVRVVVLRGAGGKFCAGGDIKSMKKRVDCYAAGIRPETETKINMNNFNKLVLSVRQMEKPVISWIEGACAGGGLSLAMASDFSIAEEDAKMTMAFVGIGLAPDMGSSLMMSRRVGPARATDLFMTGRRFTGKEAADMGIITRAVPAEELEAAVLKQAAKLASGPACSYAEIKATVNRIFYSDLYQCMNMEADYIDRLTHTADHAEAVNAFLEKRKPEFQGK
jgi:2-(1,2-epoxy-1,2-dihydrophenyl)acetyl-CoA isomerase